MWPVSAAIGGMPAKTGTALHMVPSHSTVVVGSDIWSSPNPRLNLHTLLFFCVCVGEREREEEEEEEDFCSIISKVY